MSTGDKVVEIAQKMGRTPAQVAINWVRQQNNALVIPVLGARTLAQMQENLGGLDFELPGDFLQEIDQLSNFRTCFPWDFLHDDEVLGLVHGKTYLQIDNHRAD
jgi:aryl-alcohol dehydrogenase-like predicted oxidoreductase